MKQNKSKDCECCGQEVPEPYLCDMCDGHIGIYGEEAVELCFHFGSVLDGDRYLFCDDNCFIKWVHRWANEGL